MTLEDIKSVWFVRCECGYHRTKRTEDNWCPGCERFYNIEYILDQNIPEGVIVIWEVEEL